MAKRIPTVNVHRQFTLSLIHVVRYCVAVANFLCVCLFYFSSRMISLKILFPFNQSIINSSSWEIILFGWDSKIIYELNGVSKFVSLCQYVDGITQHHKHYHVNADLKMHPTNELSSNQFLGRLIFLQSHSFFSLYSVELSSTHFTTIKYVNENKHTCTLLSMFYPEPECC